MTFLGITLTALAVLFLLTAMALAADRQLRHPVRALLGLVALLVVGLAMLFE